MWIGTATGLYLLDKESGGFERIKLPVESTYIYSLYQEDGNLYIEPVVQDYWYTIRK